MDRPDFMGLYESYLGVYEEPQNQDYEAVVQFLASEGLVESYEEADALIEQMSDEDILDILEVTGGGLIKGYSTKYADESDPDNLSPAQQRRDEVLTRYQHSARTQAGDIDKKALRHAERSAGIRSKDTPGGITPERKYAKIKIHTGGFPFSARSKAGTQSGLRMAPSLRALTRADELGKRGDNNSLKRANKIRREVDTNKNLNASYEYDLYDLVLEYLLDEGLCESVKNAEVMMAHMSEEWVDAILDEAARPGQRERGYNRASFQKMTDRRLAASGSGFRSPKAKDKMDKTSKIAADAQSHYWRSKPES